MMAVSPGRSASGKMTIDVYDYELHASFVYFVEADRAARLPFGVKAAFTVNDDVSGLARHEPCVHILARDERPILSVAGVVEFWIQPQVVAGK